MRKAPERPLLALIKAGGVNEMPAPALAAITGNTSGRDENILLTLRVAVKTAGKAVGGKIELARMLGICRQAVYAWRKIPAERVVEVERLTGVRREELRPDLYQPLTLTTAIEMLKAAGYRVSKPRKQKNPKRGKDRVGPTCVAKFNDGTVTRMSTYTALENFDWDRGERLSQAAWQSRWRMHKRAEVGRLVTLWAPTPPAIAEMCFEEQDGRVLARRLDSGSAP
jgi:DNA-binding transcriptional regulator YdaS (Cro superfamily)